MRPPCEIVVRFLLPLLRAKIAEILIEEGKMSKKEVAAILGVSQASVSKYKKVLHEENPLRSEVIDKKAREIAEMILKGASEERILMKICSLCFVFRQGGELCQYHRKKENIQECDICSKYFSISPELKEEEEIIAKMQKALDKIIKTPEFSLLIPEVRSNIVMAKREAKGVEDVAGIPGRITVINGRPHALKGPEFGASKHTSRILLEAMRFSDFRVALCIKFNKEVLRALKRLKFSWKRIERRSNTLEDFSRAFECWKSIPEVVIDPGGPGIEPVAYLFGKDPEEVLEKALKILKEIIRGEGSSS